MMDHRPPVVSALEVDASELTTPLTEQKSNTKKQDKASTSSKAKVKSSAPSISVQQLVRDYFGTTVMEIGTGIQEVTYNLDKLSADKYLPLFLPRYVSSGGVGTIYAPTEIDVPMELAVVLKGTKTKLRLAAVAEYASAVHFVVRVRVVGDDWILFDDSRVTALNKDPKINLADAAFLLYALPGNEAANFNSQQGLYNGFDKAHTCYLNSAVQMLTRFYNVELAAAVAKGPKAGSVLARLNTIDGKLRASTANVGTAETDVVALRDALHAEHTRHYAPNTWDEFVAPFQDILDAIETTAGSDLRVHYHRQRADGKKDVITDSFYITLGVPLTESDVTGGHWGVHSSYLPISKVLDEMSGVRAHFGEVATALCKSGIVGKSTVSINDAKEGDVGAALFESLMMSLAPLLSEAEPSSEVTVQTLLDEFVREEPIFLKEEATDTTQTTVLQALANDHYLPIFLPRFRPGSSGSVFSSESPVTISPTVDIQLRDAPGAEATAVTLHLAAFVTYAGGNHFHVTIRTGDDEWYNFNDDTVTKVEAIKPSTTHTTFALYARQANRVAAVTTQVGLFNGPFAEGSKNYGKHTCYMNSAVQVLSRFYTDQFDSCGAVKAEATDVTARVCAVRAKLTGSDSTVATSQDDVVALRNSLHAAYPVQYFPGQWDEMVVAFEHILDQLEGGHDLGTSRVTLASKFAIREKVTQMHMRYITLGVKASGVAGRNRQVLLQRLQSSTKEVQEIAGALFKELCKSLEEETGKAGAQIIELLREALVPRVLGDFTSKSGHRALEIEPFDDLSEMADAFRHALFYASQPGEFAKLSENAKLSVLAVLVGEKKQAIFNKLTESDEPLKQLASAVAQAAGKAKRKAGKLFLDPGNAPVGSAYLTVDKPGEMLQSLLYALMYHEEGANVFVAHSSKKGGDKRKGKYIDIAALVLGVDKDDVTVRPAEGPKSDDLAELSHWTFSGTTTVKSGDLIAAPESRELTKTMRGQSEAVDWGPRLYALSVQHHMAKLRHILLTSDQAQAVAETVNEALDGQIVPMPTVFVNLRPQRKAPSSSSDSKPLEPDIPTIVFFAVERLGAGVKEMRFIFTGSVGSGAPGVADAVDTIHNSFKGREILLELVDISEAFLPKAKATVHLAGGRSKKYKATGHGALSKAIAAASGGFVEEIATYKFMGRHSAGTHPRVAVGLNSGTLDWFGYVGIPTMRLNSGTSVDRYNRFERHGFPCTSFTFAVTDTGDERNLIKTKATGELEDMPRKLGRHPSPSKSSNNFLWIFGESHIVHLSSGAGVRYTKLIYVNSMGNNVDPGTATSSLE